MEESILIKTRDKNNWEQDLHCYDHSVFICSDWLEIVQSPTHTPIFFDFVINQTIAKIGGLSIKEGFLTKKSLYFYSGPAIKEDSQKHYNACIKSLYNYAIKNKYSRVIIGSYDSKSDIEINLKPFYKTERVEYVIPIKNGYDTLEFRSQFKRNCKKAKKQKPSLQGENSKNALNTLKHLIEETHRKREKKYQTKYNHFYLNNFNNTTLQNILNSKNANIYTTAVDNEVNCAELIYTSNNSCYMLLKGSNKYAYQYGMSSYLSNELIRIFETNNIKTYNLGGRPNGPDGDGLAAYKLGSGAREVKCHGAATYYLTWPLKILNPILRLGRKLPQENKAVLTLKKLIS